MASCAIEPCGRKDLEEPAPGLELWEGKWSCTLCYCNAVRFPQMKRKKKYEPPDAYEPRLAKTEKVSDLFTSEDD